MRRLKRQKNNLLKTTALLMTIIFVVALSMPEEAGWYGVVLTVIPYTWLFLFAYVNLFWEKRGSDGREHHTEG